MSFVSPWCLSMETVKQLDLMKHFQSILLCIWFTDWNCCHYHCISEEARFLFVKWSYSTIEKRVFEMVWLLSYFAQSTASEVNQIIWIITSQAFDSSLRDFLPKYTNKYFTTVFLNLLFVRYHLWYVAGHCTSTQVWTTFRLQSIFIN